jgi:thiol:disulfide interchange protein
MKIVFLLTMLLFAGFGFSQSVIYNPNEDAKNSLDSCISKAKKENKHVLVQIGGNWCKWCIEFHRFAKADSKIDSLLNADYVYYLLNYSKENKNLEMLSKLGFPQRFGFPVFVVINGDGVRLHTQNSSYLEDGGKSYDNKKVIEFLKQWSFDSIDPKNY